MNALTRNKKGYFLMDCDKCNEMYETKQRPRAILISFCPTCEKGLVY